jgi:acetyltransferase-like isoleucine patch superfamily enzyme
MAGEKLAETIRSVVKELLVWPILAIHLIYRLGWVQFLTVSRSLALVPGAVGVWWRANWYARTLAGCGKGLYVDWLAAIKTPKTRVGDNVFIGPSCWVGWADIGDEVMLGGHIVILSGAHHHHFDRLDIPMTQQQGELSQVRIGDDVWVGNGAILMADVASGSVIAAGAVVTKTFEPYSILAGVPARVIRKREQSAV